MPIATAKIAADPLGQIHVLPTPRREGCVDMMWFEDYSEFLICILLPFLAEEVRGIASPEAAVKQEKGLAICL